MRFVDGLIIAFLVSHIPITLLVDGQAVLPKSWYPQSLLDVQSWYLDTYQDPLMRDLPLWFKSLVYTEVFLQLPFFLLGSYAWIARKNWIRIPALIYGSFVASTMVPILAVLSTHRAPGYDPLVVTGFYLPYAVVPSIIVIYMALVERPFGGGGGGRPGKPKRA
eukprot:scaffold10.g2386.t1